MSFHIIGHQAENITVAIPVYEGPLDLLLDLIEKAELDITRVALAQVTEQYLEYIRKIQYNDPAEVSAFLVIAAKLIQIKSEAILPRPPEREQGEEDPGETLTNMLIQYKKFKRVGVWLLERFDNHMHTHLRVASPLKIETKIDLNGLTSSDLALFAFTVLNQKDKGIILDQVVSIPLVTIRNRIYEILADLKQKESVRFKQIIGDPNSRLDIIVTFLAVLELIKRNVVIAEQESLFADISLVADKGIQQISDLNTILDDDY